VRQLQDCNLLFEGVSGSGLDEPQVDVCGPRTVSRSIGMFTGCSADMRENYKNNLSKKGELIY
jgi:hypothetical protein